MVPVVPAALLMVDQATLELKSLSASDGVASVAVALLTEEQATLELKSSSASDGVASVAVALLMAEQATRTKPQRRSASCRSW